MFKVNYFEHTADIGFTLEADSFSELCKGAATVTFEAMGSLKKIGKKIGKKVVLQNKEYDKLLFEFIEELIFLKDSDYMLFSDFKVKIEEEKTGITLRAEVKGEKINPKKHELKVDVKAITFHEFYVKQKGKRWEARIILDI